MERAFRMSVADVYPLYIQKVERKGRTKADVDEVTRWLTGFTQAELDAHLASGTTLRAPDRTQAFGAVALPPGTPGGPW